MDQATLRRHRRGLREVEHAQDVQIIRTVAMRLWHLPQFQTGDAFLEERSVKRVGSQFTMRFQPKRDGLKAPKRTESLGDAADDGCGQGAKSSPLGISASQQCTLEHCQKKILGQILRVAYRITAVTDESENGPPIVLAEFAQCIVHRWIPSSGIGARENLHLVERWTRLDAKTLEYAVTIEDPTVWTKPWTVKQELVKQDEQANRIYYEPRCLEGNYGLPSLLLGTRREEAAFAEGRGADPATKDRATCFGGDSGEDPLAGG